MHPLRFRLMAGALVTLGLTFVCAGHAPWAGEAKKDEPKPLAPLPAVFSKEQPESVDDLKAIEQHVESLLPKITPAVVCVRVGAGQGSGIIVSKDGYVLTAGHVSGDPDKSAIIILPNGKQLKGKTLGRNGGIDSGMVKITDAGEWPFVDMGTSSSLKKGQWVIAIGHPGGFRINRTPVVRVGRVLFSNGYILRTDCALVGGDSGGPLFDMNGKVVGIHSRIGSFAMTENMHVPIDTYRQTWDRLVKAENWGGPIGQVPLVQSPGGKIIYQKDGKFTSANPKDTKQTDSFAQVHRFKMVPGFVYTIDMAAPDQKKVDPYLRLEDSTGKQIAEDDDGAGGLNARIVVRPTREDEYRIIATTFEPNQTGPYTLVIREAEIKIAMVAGKVDVLPAIHMPKPAARHTLVEKLTQAGVPVYASGTLFDEAGKPIAGKPVQFRWEKGTTTLKTDVQGMLRLQLSKDNVRHLVLEIPDGHKLGLELTDGAGNPFNLGIPPDFDKAKVKSAGGKNVLQEKGELTIREPLDKLRADMVKRGLKKACYFKIHTFKMEPGSTYTIDLESEDFDAYLRLEDPSNKQLAEDDDGAGNLNSRIVFTPDNDGVYRIIVTTCDPGQWGSYRLAIHESPALDRRNSVRP